MRMVERIGERIARRAAERRAAALAAGLAEALPGVRVERRGLEVRVSGRGLARRVLDEPGLRDPASVLR